MRENPNQCAPFSDDGDRELFELKKDKLNTKAAKKLFAPGDIVETKFGRLAVISVQGRRIRAIPVYDIYWDGDFQTARVLEKRGMDGPY